MRAQGRELFRLAAYAGALFLALVVFGLATRPLALLLSGLYAFHAVLIALPSACALAYCLRKSRSIAACAVAVSLFAAMLGCMSPLMGWAAFAPMALAGIVWVAAHRLAPNRRACAAGFAYGALYYPCTIVLSVAFGGTMFALGGESLAKVLVSAALGVALSGLGVLLAAGRSHGSEGV